MIALTVLLAACGGGADDSTSDDPGTSSGEDQSAGSDSGGGSVVDPQPPGQAIALVDGLEIALNQPGGVDCMVGGDGFSFSFNTGDNEISIGGGAIPYEGDWVGSIDVRIANPEGEDGPIAYFHDLSTATVAIDGVSVSITGPMQKQPPNDGSNPPPVAVGDGTISMTCP